MKRKVPKQFLQAVATHRNKLEKVLSGGAAAKMKRLYDSAQDELMSKLRRSIKAGKGEKFTAFHQRVVLAQLRQGQAIITKRLAKEMGPLTKKAQEVALKGLIEDVSLLNYAFTGSDITLPVEEASVFAGVIEGREPSILRANQESFARYGVRVVSDVEDALAQSLLEGASPGEVMDDVAELIDGEWWRGERIVRTESSMAFNSTHRDGIEESAKEIPELGMRWEEFCDDEGRPLDDRVGVDSIAMHGQVCDADGTFTMPAEAPFPTMGDKKGRTDVPDGLVGLTWDHPPNRPNDRSTLSPWMPDWGVPGWRYSNGRRIWL